MGPLDVEIAYFWEWMVGYSCASGLANELSNRMRSLLSLLQVIEVAADHPDLGLLGLLKYQAYFAGLLWCRHSATRSETFASPTHITVSAPPQ